VVSAARRGRGGPRAPNPSSRSRRSRSATCPWFGIPIEVTTNRGSPRSYGALLAGRKPTPRGRRCRSRRSSSTLLDGQLATPWRRLRRRRRSQRRRPRCLRFAEPWPRSVARRRCRPLVTTLSRLIALFGPPHCAPRRSPCSRLVLTQPWPRPSTERSMRSDASSRRAIPMTAVTSGSRAARPFRTATSGRPFRHFNAIQRRHAHARASSMHAANAATYQMTSMEPAIAAASARSIAKRYLGRQGGGRIRRLLHALGGGWGRQVLRVRRARLQLGLRWPSGSGRAVFSE